jgi:hypothetical protein
MLYIDPEGDSANEAQFPPFVGPMSLVVILLPFTWIANTSPDSGKLGVEVV